MAAAWCGRRIATAQDQDVGGLTSDSSWKSPQFGNVVLWGDDWTIDSVNTLTDPANLLDRLTIVHDSGPTLVVMFIEAGDEESTDYAGRLVRYRRITNPEATLLDNEQDRGVTTLVYRSRIDRQDIVNFIDIRKTADDERFRVVEMVGYLRDIDVAFVDIQNEVSIDGDVPFPDREIFPIETLD